MIHCQYFNGLYKKYMLVDDPRYFYGILEQHVLRGTDSLHYKLSISVELIMSDI